MKTIDERERYATRCDTRSEACNFIKKETLAQVFSCDFCEIFQNTFFTEHLRATASENHYLLFYVDSNFRKTEIKKISTFSAAL